MTKNAETAAQLRRQGADRRAFAGRTTVEFLARNAIAAAERDEAQAAQIETVAAARVPSLSRTLHTLIDEYAALDGLAREAECRGDGRKAGTIQRAADQLLGVIGLVAEESLEFNLQIERHTRAGRLIDVVPVTVLAVDGQTAKIRYASGDTDLVPVTLLSPITRASCMDATAHSPCIDKDVFTARA